MGYNTQTNVICTNPCLIGSGSTFNQQWADCILEIKSGSTSYYCSKEYLNDAIIELSKKHPEETFTGVTWNDSDFETCIKYTLIIKNGEYEVVKMEPEYQVFFPVIEDNEYKRLSSRFRDHIALYLKRLDILKNDPIDGYKIDILNDKKDSDGFKSYFVIIWENGEHRFTATKRFISQVVVGYEKKQSRKGELP